MQAGSVLFIEAFEFQDGGRSDKLLLVLNNPTENEPYLIVPTTSKQHNKLQQIGCHSNYNYYYIDKDQDGFLENTWIVFHIVYTIDIITWLTKSIKGNSKLVFDLDPLLWKIVKNCILKSQDISLGYLEMIKKS